MFTTHEIDPTKKRYEIDEEGKTDSIALRPNEVWPYDTPSHGKYVRIYQVSIRREREVVQHNQSTQLTYDNTVQG